VAGLKLLTSRTSNLAVVLPALLVATPSFAAGGAALDYYGMITHALHIDHKWVPSIGALFMTVVIALVGLRYKAAVAGAGDDVVPNGRFGLRYIVEQILDIVTALAKDNTHEHYRKFLPFMAALFVFILFNNVSGLVPGFPPATVSMATNVAMGLIVFIVYNAAGIKEHGGSYIKQFMGPVIFIMPLFLSIELISHAARPLSLGLRLMCNVYGDHVMLSEFTKLTWLVVPALLMFFGLLVSVVQAFVFTLLTGIYISMAMSHDH